MNSYKKIKEKLLEHARAARENAYCPYSGFKVGAAVITSDGTIFSGSNIENSSYGLTICAERVAVFKAVSSGKKGIAAIAISSSSNTPAYPCGACRQVLSEFNLKMAIYLDHDPKRYSLSALFPNAFSKDQIS